MTDSFEELKEKVRAKTARKANGDTPSGAGKAPSQTKVLLELAEATQLFRSPSGEAFGELRGLPRNDRDLFVMAKGARVLGYDNVSGLPTWLSDAMCTISNGGGYGARALYTDNEESVISACCPQILTGIEDVIIRSDLVGRSILLSLEPISKEARRPKKELFREFNAASPRILGAFFDAVVVGLKNLPASPPPSTKGLGAERLPTCLPS